VEARRDQRGVVASVNLSRGGVPKLPVRSARATRLGLAGDVQRLKKIHGGPDRALCLFSLEVIAALRAAGHPIAPGGAGENVTLSGLDWPSLAEGDRLSLGDVVVELTTTTDPCKQIAACFADRNPWHLGPRATTRWYARVLVEGDLAVGAPVTSR
jgi:MOSC domain-containing protein YiiM